MVDLNLRELSAPIEALRPKVDAAYKLLDEQWKAIAAQLSELPIPCSIIHSYATNDDGSECYTLEWRKWKGSKRLCTAVNFFNGQDELEDVTPFEEWGAEHKLEMLKHVPGLFKDAAVQTERFIKRINGKGGAK